MSTVPAGVRTVPDRSPGVTSLVLVRHGEARCNVQGVVGGIRGCTGLTDLGVAQAEALRRRLERTGELRQATALYSSVLPRAIETAALVSPALGPGDLPVQTDCDLCELHPGEADGLVWEQYVARYGEPDAWGTQPDAVLSPGGESWSSFVTRASSAVASLTERHGGQTVVVVCHAGVIESALLRLLPFGPEARLQLRTSHASLTEFERDGALGVWRLLRYNDAVHLVEDVRPGAAPPLGRRDRWTAGR